MRRNLIRRLALIELRDGSVRLRRHIEAAHVGVDLGGASIAVDGLLRVHLAETVAGLGVVGGRVVFGVAGTRVELRTTEKAIAGLRPVLGHLEEIAGLKMKLTAENK